MQSDHPSPSHDSMVEQSQQHFAVPAAVPSQPHKTDQQHQQHITQQPENKVVVHNQPTHQTQNQSQQKHQIPLSPLENKVNYFEKEDIKGKILFDMKLYFEKQLWKKASSGFYSEYVNVPSKQDEDRVRFGQIFDKMVGDKNYSPSALGLSLRQSRGIAAVMGMAICDALGASTEFQKFKKQGLGVIKNGFSDIKQGRHGMIGVWTDDASMGLCMADSILLNDFIFNATHIRYLFNLWLHHGLNNGGRPFSIGLGGNIAISMDEFLIKQQPYTQQGERFNNGNGSLMRLAPIPVAFADNLQAGVQYSGLSSKTTHNGWQAEECCRLMGKIIIELVNRPEHADGKQVLKQICDNFQTECKSVYNLARAQCDSQQLYKQLMQKNKKFKSFNKKLEDRNWNWRDPSHTYSPTRLKQQPGYIGSYCMDALAMALHTVWFTDSFKQIAIMNADLGGDCDTVGSIAGQIAGAMYGVDEQMLTLYSEMQDFQRKKYQVFIKGYKLINKKILK